jgi:hypothetical protein
MHGKREGCFVQCGRIISLEEIDEIRETVAVFHRLSREELAVTICEHLEWYSASGTPKADACLNHAYPDVAHRHFNRADLPDASTYPRIVPRRSVTPPVRQFSTRYRKPPTAKIAG